MEENIASASYARHGYWSAETNDGPMQVYYSYPAKPQARYKVVIVLQEAFGVNDHIKDICHWLNEHGYLAVAPELFHRIGDFVEVDYSDRKSIMPLLAQLKNDHLLEDLRASWQLLQQQTAVDLDHISALGFCMGGFAAILAAIHLDLRSVISFYGAGVIAPREGIGFGAILPDLDKLKSPLLLIYGEDDPSITFHERYEITQRLQEQHKHFEMEVFAHSNHGFFCNERKSYQPKAAKAAWERTLRWLDLHG